MILQTCAPENFRSCRWGDERTVKGAQTVSEDPHWRERNSRNVFILELEVLTNFGILHILPSLFLESAEIPQLGAKPSSTFHT